MMAQTLQLQKTVVPQLLHCGMGAGSCLIYTLQLVSLFRWLLVMPDDTSVHLKGGVVHLGHGGEGNCNPRGVMHCGCVHWVRHQPLWPERQSRPPDLRGILFL